MFSEFNNLNEAFCKERFGELYAAYSLKNKTMLMYWGFEYVRKLCLALVVVFIQEDLGLQTSALFISCLCIAAAGAFIRTKESAFDRAMEMFNEVKLIVIMYHMMFFSEFGPEPES